MRDEKGPEVRLLKYLELREKLRSFKEKERAAGVDMFMGIPDHWFENPRWRCHNDHVGVMYLKSEEVGMDLCLTCFEPVALSFPSDKDGPLQEVANG